MKERKPCSFCTNITKEEREIVRNDLAWAFPTNIPIVPGHTLVCPVRCVAKFEDLTKEEKMAIFDLTEKVKKSLAAAFQAEGFNYAWNENEVGGQAVAHFHLHILPRKKGDTGIYEYEPRKFLYRTSDERKLSTREELAHVAELIRKNM
jgi:diadenosine tetraphosphate (Ap4A) HIT family hydrolase